MRRLVLARLDKNGLRSDPDQHPRVEVASDVPGAADPALRGNAIVSTGTRHPQLEPMAWTGPSAAPETAIAGPHNQRS